MRYPRFSLQLVPALLLNADKRVYYAGDLFFQTWSVLLRNSKRGLVLSFTDERVLATARKPYTLASLDFELTSLFLDTSTTTSSSKPLSHQRLEKRQDMSRHRTLSGGN